MKLQIYKITYISFYKTSFYKDFMLKGKQWNILESSWCNSLTITKR